MEDKSVVKRMRHRGSRGSFECKLVKKARRLPGVIETQNSDSMLAILTGRLHWRCPILAYVSHQDFNPILIVLSMCGDDLYMSKNAGRRS
jgi:hypothetical protein